MEFTKEFVDKTTEKFLVEFPNDIMWILQRCFRNAPKKFVGEFSEKIVLKVPGKFLMDFPGLFLVELPKELAVECQDKFMMKFLEEIVIEYMLGIYVGFLGVFPDETTR